MSAAFDRDYPDLDLGIRERVRVLRAGGIETFESCEGGDGHAYAEPTVRFYGHRDQGWKALHVALESGLPVDERPGSTQLIDGEPVGPYWELTFLPGRD